MLRPNNGYFRICNCCKNIILSKPDLSLISIINGSKLSTNSSEDTHQDKNKKKIIRHDFLKLSGAIGAVTALCILLYPVVRSLLAHIIATMLLITLIR